MIESQSPSSTDRESGIHYLDSGIQNVESRGGGGNGYKLSAQLFPGSFGWTSVTCDWLIFALSTPNDPRNGYAESLYPFPL